MTSRVRRSSAGFSLAELMIVIAVIIVLAATTIPMGLNFVRTYKITGAAQGLAAEIQKARSVAVKRNSPRGILLNFNYPVPGQYQFTSLDPDPLTGGWDGAIYPSNPGIFDANATVDYGQVPAPPNNLVDPPDTAAVRVESPHGTPVELPFQIQFEDGERNALLFRADGRVAAVNAGGPAGGATLARSADGLSWEVVIRDAETNLARVIRVTPAGRVIIEQPPLN